MFSIVFTYVFISILFSYSNSNFYGIGKLSFKVFRVRNIITSISLGELREYLFPYPVLSTQHLPKSIIEQVSRKQSWGLIAARKHIPYHACYIPSASIAYQGATTSVDYQTQPSVGYSSVNPFNTGVDSFSSSPYVPVPSQLTFSPTEGDFFTPMSAQSQYDFSSLFTNPPIDYANYGMQFMTLDYLSPDPLSLVVSIRFEFST